MLEIMEWCDDCMCLLFDTGYVILVYEYVIVVLNCKLDYWLCPFQVHACLISLVKLNTRPLPFLCWKEDQRSEL